MDLVGRLIKDGHTRYRVREIVGTWGDNNEYAVYRCQRLPERLQYPSVAIKVLPTLANNEDFWVRISNERVQFDECFQHRPRNLSFYIKSYIDTLLNVRSCFTILPFQNIRTIRSLLVNTEGMPMRFTAFLVKECLNGLVEIHDFGFSHGKVSAGTLFYNPADLTGIKLAYGPTYYVSDLHQVPEPGHMPMNQIGTWALDINEVLGNGGLPPANAVDEFEVDEDPEVSFRKKQDIWFIGVLALEIAYGYIGVQNREEFLRAVRHILAHTGLPNNWSQLKTRAMYRSTDRRSILCHPRLSREYVDFLHCCFNLTMAERPSARALLNHDFLNREVSTMEEFHNSVVINLQ